jgi:hypothetical protein
VEGALGLTLHAGSQSLPECARLSQKHLGKSIERASVRVAQSLMRQGIFRIEAGRNTGGAPLDRDARSRGS